jgi:ubiquinone/menaquinone biosynthesis C-methylase UbiE
VADAYSPRLPEGSFDLVYCRLVLSHLTQSAALAAMRRLARPGGLVVWEEIDIGCWLCDPPAATRTRFFSLNAALGQRHGKNFFLGASLHRLFHEVGFARPKSMRTSRWHCGENRSGFWA